MKKIDFYKMHGAGNDYVYIDSRQDQIENPNDLSIKISDRHFGVGSDGLVLVMNSDVADYRMRMFNADGSEAGMCGNASRCVGKFLYDLNITDKTEIKLETKSGIKILKLTVVDGKVESVSVDMDKPILEPALIPMVGETNKNVKATVDGVEYDLTCVSMGNPHAVTYVDDVENFDVEGVGRKLEVHPLFPEKCNIEFAQIVNDSHIKMRVWERGSGETLACGTGSCATLVASHLNGLCGREAKITLLGGEVTVEWNSQSDRVILTGGATFVFKGEYYYE